MQVFISHVCENHPWIIGYFLMELTAQTIERFYYIIVKNNLKSIILDYSRPILLFFKSKSRNKGLKDQPLDYFFHIQPSGNLEIATISKEKASIRFNSKSTRFIVSRYPLTMDPNDDIDIIFLTPYKITFEKSDRFPEVVSLQLFEQTLLSSLGDGIYIRNFKDEIIFANQRYCDLLGLEPSEIIGKLSTNLLVQDSLRKSDLIDLDDFLEERTAHTYIGKVNRKDKDIWVEVTSSMLTFQAIPFAIAGIVRDVSQREDLMRDLREAFLINENITAFVSHEIRGALTAIHGFSEYLIFNPELFGNSLQVMNYLEVILSSSKRIENITNDILTSFSLTHGTSSTLNLISTNTVEIITQCVAELSGLIEAKNIRIKVKAVDYQSPIIQVDRGKFCRVIVNLLENAIKYSPKFSTVTVTIASVEETSMAKISITDEGIGIQKEDLELIFTQFHRGRNVGMIKGTGLGLYIAKKFIDLMGGNLSIHSEGLGKGSQIIIHVPLSIGIRPKSLKDSKILI